MDLKGIAEAYQLVYEKKADKDYDGDGKVESGAKEYRGAVHNAIQKKKGGKPDGKDTSNVKKGHDCASKVKHEEYGVGDCIKEMHTLDSAGNVTHYDVMFEHGMEKNVFVGDLNVLVSEMHEHVINTDKNKEVLGNNDLMSAYYSMYEHHQKDADGNVIPHEDEEEVKESINLSFVDELSEEELDTLVEGVVYDLLDEGIELDAIEGAFTEYLEEATVTMGSAPDYVSPEEKMTAAVKKKREEKAKASKEKTEKLKKSVGKAVTGMKAKMHGKMADYAGKRGLIPAKTKMKKPDGRKKIYRDEGGKDVLAKDKAKFAKAKDRKQSSSNIKVSMMGGGAKDTRSKLRSAVFKDVKDRVGKKTSDVKSGVGKATKSVIVAPKKVGQGIRGIAKKGKDLAKIGRQKIGGGITKAGDALTALGKKMAEQGGELDMFDTVTAYLIDEGLVRDFDHAQRVMSTLDSTLIEEVHAQQLQLLEGYGGSTDKPMLVTNADKKGNTPAYQNFKAGMKSKTTGKKMYKAADHMSEVDKLKNESLADAYLKVYEEKSTGDKLKDIAKKKQAKFDAQPQAYKNNPAFGDESHHSNAKNK